MAVTTIHNLDFRRRREALGWSLDDLCVALGVNPSSVRPAISRWERGRGELPRDITAADIDRVLRGAELGASK